jgi:hypothetical protein
LQIPLVQDHKILHMSKPLPDLSVKFEKYSFRDISEKRRHMGIKALRELEKNEEAQRSEEMVAEYIASKSRREISVSFLKLGHVRSPTNVVLTKIHKS